MNRVFIDVREPEEFKSGHVHNAVNIPLAEIGNIKSYFKDLSQDSEIIVYCRSGNRSGLSKNILEQSGYANAINGINKENVAEKYSQRLT